MNKVDWIHLSAAQMGLVSMRSGYPIYAVKPLVNTIQCVSNLIHLSAAQMGLFP